MRINPGRLRQRIEIQKYAVVQDELGNEAQAWLPWLSLFARCGGLYGAEYWAAAGQGQEDTVVFTVRWGKRLAELAREKDLTLYRIVSKGGEYEIKSYDNVDGQNVLVKLRAVSK